MSIQYRLTDSPMSHKNLQYSVYAVVLMESSDDDVRVYRALEDGRPERKERLNKFS